jgi:CubicO group peptidase (beta-lactamase class C family)
MKRHVFLLAVAAAFVAAALGFAQSAAPPAPASVDAVFARWNAASPGCAVGVGVDGRHVLERAYGMADLERDVPNTADTIFEAGSVSKQFTAAAVLLLARDGKLSLDDPVRKYVPEVPDYGAGRTITIRHMLTHTSGLRDWGEVAGLAGWPRGRRVHTHGHVLDIVSRQKDLNFTPGTNWSYSNTGYNLAAIIVSRVSGQSFAEFSRDRVRTRGRRLPGGHAVRERARQRRAAHHGRRSAALERELRFAEGRRRGVRGGAADAREVQRRTAARLRPGTVRPYLSRRP